MFRGDSLAFVGVGGALLCAAFGDGCGQLGVGPLLGFLGQQARVLDGGPALAFRAVAAGALAAVERGAGLSMGRYGQQGDDRDLLMLLG
jgi:hypothetical protein